jgi:hypothetical protein
VPAGEAITRDHLPAADADIALCRKAWLSVAGSIPDEAARMLARNECFFALLLLLETIAGPRLVRWRVRFIEGGRSYEGSAWISDEAGEVHAYEHHHPSSMARSLLAVIEQVGEGRVKVPDRLISPRPG